MTHAPSCVHGQPSTKETTHSPSDVHVHENLRTQSLQRTEGKWIQQNTRARPHQSPAEGQQHGAALIDGELVIQLRRVYRNGDSLGIAPCRAMAMLRGWVLPSVWDMEGEEGDEIEGALHGNFNVIRGGVRKRGGGWGAVRGWRAEDRGQITQERGERREGERRGAERRGRREFGKACKSPMGTSCPWASRGCIRISARPVRKLPPSSRAFPYTVHNPAGSSSQDIIPKSSVLPPVPITKHKSEMRMSSGIGMAGKHVTGDA